MKKVELIEAGSFKTADIIRQIFEVPVADRKISYEKMGAVVDILKELKEANGSLLLEDDQHAVLSGMIKEFPFGATTVDLYTILKGIVDAPKYTVPKPQAKPE